MGKSNLEIEQFSQWKIYDATSISKKDLNRIFLSNFNQSNRKLDQSKKKFTRWKKEADQGSQNAQFCIGFDYEKGIGTQKSYKSAFYYYKLAADKGHSEAETHLANLFEKGLGTEQSFSQALYYYKLAADQGNPSAQAKLGKFYLEGKGITKSIEKATYYYKLAAEKDCLEAWYYLEKAYRNGIGVEKSEKKSTEYTKKIFRFYEKQAASGNVLAQFSIGKYFEFGVLVEKSQELAIHYYKQAADQGYIVAQTHLGNYLLKHNINKELGLNYLISATKNISPENHKLIAIYQYEIGMLFAEGVYVKKSGEKAIQYLKLSADSGYSSALVKLAYYYESGMLVKKSLEKAFYYYKLLADTDDKWGLFELARCYRLGIGIEKSLEKAIEYYTLSLKMGYNKELIEHALHLCQKELSQNQENIQTETKIDFWYGHSLNSLDIHQYLKSHNIQILKKIFNKNKKMPYLLEWYAFTKEEAETICEAMIQNQDFTFICASADRINLFYAFKKNGYNPRSCLNCCPLISKTTKQSVLALSFNQRNE